MSAPADSPLVSVVIPTYNSAAHLPGTLASVWAQTYDRYEVIVVDDGSSDGTGDVIAAAQDRVDYIRLDHFGGPSRPRNIGVQKARGEWVAFLDSDDLMAPDKLARTVAAIAACPAADLAFTDFRVIDENGLTRKESFLAEYRSFRRALQPADLPDCSTLAGDPLRRELLSANFIGTSSVTVKRSALLEVGGFDETLKNADDIDMWHRLARAGRTFLFLDVPLHSYRRRTDSVTRRGADRYPSVIRMHRKQLAHIDDPLLKAQQRQRIRAVIVAHGQALSEAGRYAEASRAFREAASLGPGWDVVRGLAKSLALSWIRSGRRRSGR